ncbi:uncharacterized protein KQ657_003859 [Scheffersomyces spartinae]|uniref:VASt domain-containing protein n=1 Tax=Scheffersomyces spartinae TaxID=45513 RepID=A0A9P8AK00_9ASCO|nr:uncharacterized protein KQ657_003859 [Scheffersomyces spartinae]KAG7195331.1 hypothetical protein KQ657_003859 [Scheffersomyces spartinae]
MLSTQVLPRPQLRGRSTSPVLGRSPSITLSKSPTGTRPRNKTFSNVVSPSPNKRLSVPHDLNSVEFISSSSPKREIKADNDDIEVLTLSHALSFDVPGIESTVIPEGVNLTNTKGTDITVPLLTTSDILDNDNEHIADGALDSLEKPTANEVDGSGSSLGIFSTLINAANNILSKDGDGEAKNSKRNSLLTLSGNSKSNSALRKSLTLRRDDTFENKLDSLLGKHDNLLSMASKDPELNISKNLHSVDGLDPSGLKSSKMLLNQSTNDRASIPASVVQFESVKDSPLNTLGKGDLSLASFDRRLSRISDLTVAMSNFDNHPQGSPNLQVNGSNVGRTLSSMPRSMSMDSKISQHTSRNPLAPALSKSVPEDDDVLSTTEQSISYSDTQDNLTGDTIKFALELKNRNFHQQFKEVPLTDNLIEDYSCALSKDILIQGKMYLSSNYICFKSNILGWVTNLTIPLAEVVQIEKKSTGGIFPNGIIIRTLHRRYTFATFLSRDNTFILISKVWRNVLEQAPGDVATNRPRGTSIASSRYIADEESPPNMLGDEEVDITDEGELVDEDDSEDIISGGNDTISDALSRQGTARQAATTQGSNKGAAEEADADPDASTSIDEAKPKSNGKATANSDDSNTFFGFPLLGPLKHAEVIVDYDKQSSDVFITDEVIPAPLGVVFSILFGQETKHIIKILKDQKNFDIAEEQILGLSALQKERTYNYTKPLGGPIGPKQTKCFLTDKIVNYDLDNHVLIETNTLTPDVPSGNSFKVKTKMYLSWASNNLTRLYVLTSVEWSAKSWFKSAVEKGSIEGQKDSIRVMIKDLKDIVEGFKTSGAKGDRKKRKKPRATSSVVEPVSEKQPEPEPAAPPPASILEQVKSLFTSITSSLGSIVEVPFVDANIVGTVLLMLILLSSRSVLRWTLGVSLNADRHSVQFVNSDKFVSRVLIDKKEYVVIPSVQSKMDDFAFEKNNDAALWRWISKRSHGGLGKDGPESKGKKQIHTSPEVLEFIGLAHDRLNELAGMH